MEIIVPVTVAFVVLYGMIKKVKIFDAFIEGAVEGLHTLYMIIPTITGLVVAVEMLQQSGTIDLVCKAVEPLADFFNFPKEIVPMAVLRPLCSYNVLWQCWYYQNKTYTFCRFTCRFYCTCFGNYDRKINIVKVLLSSIFI